MGIHDYFRAIETIAPQQVRELMDRHQPSEYNLVVKQINKIGIAASRKLLLAMT